MAKFYQLSYALNINLPLYPGTDSASIKKSKEIRKGDSCNTFFVSFSNHSGTHIDAPRHFYESGRRIGDYSPEELIFRKSFILDCPKKPKEGILPQDLKNIPRSTDIILLRTGFSKYRVKSPKVYSHENPFITPLAAVYIRKNFPKLKALAVDFISIGSFSFRELGRESHKVLLKDKGFKTKPILLIEDAYIPDKISKIDEIIVMPFLKGNIDSSPCSILGVKYD